MAGLLDCMLETRRVDRRILAKNLFVGPNPLAALGRLEQTAGTEGWMGGDQSRADFDQLLAELRPMLHRYCARMTGSAIDGEDVVQDALVKAIEALPAAGEIAHPRRWLFRI